MASVCSRTKMEVTRGEHYAIVCQLPAAKFPCGDACVVTLDVGAGGRLVFGDLAQAKFRNMSLDRVLDKKSYAIKKREMVRGAHRVRSMSYDNLQMMAGDKLEVTLLPGVQSSMLISVLWISSVIFITVLFTYTYSALQDLWWN